MPLQVFGYQLTLFGPRGGGGQIMLAILLVPPPIFFDNAPSLIYYCKFSVLILMLFEPWGTNYVHHNTTAPPRFLDLPPPLHQIVSPISK